MSDLTHDEKEPVPEADALEQAEPVDDERSDEGTTGGTTVAEMPDEVPDDVPEADALEQATPLPGEPDEESGR